jgi:hypothetical protein
MEKSLEEIMDPESLNALRRSPALYRRTRLGCALVENSGTVIDIAAPCGAGPTGRPRQWTHTGRLDRRDTRSPLWRIKVIYPLTLIKLLSI